MRILLATPLYPPDVGGPATYVKGLEDALTELGHEPTVLCYKSVLQYPSIIRQFAFFFRMLQKAKNADAIIALDTLSIGLPATIAGKIYAVPTIVRVAGDQVWERYVNRAVVPVPLPDFYANTRGNWSFTERVMFWITDKVFRLATRLVFSTKWQADIRTKAHVIPKEKIVIIENAYTLVPTTSTSTEGEAKTFLFAGRDIPMKNIPRLKEIFNDTEISARGLGVEVLTNVSHDQVRGRIKQAYALILLTYSEDSPNFILEGLAEGKPFISTMHNGLRDRINELGMFVDPTDNLAIKNAVISMAESNIYQGFREKIAAFHFIRTYNNIATEYLDLIKTL